MLSIYDSEIANQKISHNLNSAAAHCYKQYYTGRSKHCAVAVWPRGGRDGGGGHNAETDQECGVISLLTTLTGNSP
jgi:hypothetical protein